MFPLIVVLAILVGATRASYSQSPSSLDGFVQIWPLHAIAADVSTFAHEMTQDVSLAMSKRGCFRPFPRDQLEKIDQGVDWENTIYKQYNDIPDSLLTRLSIRNINAHLTGQVERSNEGFIWIRATLTYNTDPLLTEDDAVKIEWSDRDKSAIRLEKASSLVDSLCARVGRRRASILPPKSPGDQDTAVPPPAPKSEGEGEIDYRNFLRFAGGVSVSRLRGSTVNEIIDEAEALGTSANNDHITSGFGAIGIRARIGRSGRQFLVGEANLSRWGGRVTQHTQSGAQYSESFIASTWALSGRFGTELMRWRDTSAEVSAGFSVATPLILEVEGRSDSLKVERFPEPRLLFGLSATQWRGMIGIFCEIRYDFALTSILPGVRSNLLLFTLGLDLAPYGWNR